MARQSTQSRQAAAKTRTAGRQARKRGTSREGGKAHRWEGPREAGQKEARPQGQPPAGKQPDKAQAQGSSVSRADQPPRPYVTGSAGIIIIIMWLHESEPQLHIAAIHPQR